MANPSPAITFEVDLSLKMSETFGTLNNQSSVGVLHPDRHQSDQDNALAENAQRKNLISTWFPGISIGNRVLKHGDTFIEYGQKAIYMRDMYAVGYAPNDRAFLKVTDVS